MSDNFVNALAESADILKLADVLKEHNKHRNRAILRGSTPTSAIDRHALLLSKHDYDFILKDESIVQFDSSESVQRFCYIPNPKLYMSFDDFLKKNELEDELNAEENYYEIYLHELEELPERDLLRPSLRYDFDSRGYKKNVHFISHLHIGDFEDIRLPVGLVLSPQAFTFLVLKNFYVAEFTETLEAGGMFSAKYSAQKATCAKLVAPYIADVRDDFHFL